MYRKLVFAVTLIACFVLANKANAQTFSLGVDLPLVGAAGNNEFTVGAGVNVGLVHAGSIRLGMGFAGVYYPNHKYEDRGDLVFDTSLGFRLFERRKGEYPAGYFSVLYLRNVTRSDSHPRGSINNGVLMGLTFSSK